MVDEIVEVEPEEYPDGIRQSTHFYVKDAAGIVSIMSLSEARKIIDMPGAVQMLNTAINVHNEVRPKEQARAMTQDEIQEYIDGRDEDETGESGSGS